MYIYHLVLIINRVCFKVKWPLQNEVTITEAIANEAKINTRNLHESGQVQEEKLDSKQDKTEGTTSTTAITTMYTEEKLPVKNATNNVKNIIKESTLTNQ